MAAEWMSAQDLPMGLGYLDMRKKEADRQVPTRRAEHQHCLIFFLAMVLVLLATVFPFVKKWLSCFYLLPRLLLLLHPRPRPLVQDPGYCWPVL